MKKLILMFGISLFFGCSDNSEEMISSNSQFREDMRNFVIGISETSKAVHPGFAIIPQNGIELVTQNGEQDGPLATAYLDAIDGNGQEDLFFGYDEDNLATPANESTYLSAFLDRSKEQGKTILVTDYCSSIDKINLSYNKNISKNYISFAAPERELTTIPGSTPNNVNSADVTKLGEAKNFLYLINTANFSSKAAFISAVAQSNYDLVLLDLYYQDEIFTAADIEAMRYKANGGKRLLVCYMSIGEAENYRYYWNSTWNTAQPNWIAAENPAWEGNYKVQYWNPIWQGIIYKDDFSYLKKILASNFDGVYLDIIDAFEYFEE